MPVQHLFVHNQLEKQRQGSFTGTWQKTNKNYSQRLLLTQVWQYEQIMSSGFAAVHSSSFLPGYKLH